ncbi:UDP-N-acetylmuramate dehydrogenase [Idiomarina xiamenensis]|nr:UDP-N-acetylmuramate dehydrogenase [Idiomarina xiamenensis]
MIDLSNRHTFKLPVQAQALLEITSSADCETLDWQAPFVIIGDGSNTIFLADYPGTVIVNRIKGIQITAQDDYVEVRAGGGENWHQLVSQLISKNIAGLENLALIPGTVGAAPVQNIGAYGVEVAAFINQVKAWDIKLQRWQYFDANACQFDYRNSLFKRHPGRWLVTEVIFRLPQQWQAQISYHGLDSLAADCTPQAIYERVIEIRNSKLPDPAQLPNAGSFFKNPVISVSQYQELTREFSNMPSYPVSADEVKVPAGWLIDQLGLKGYRFGGAAVHQQQALVLVNLHQASGDDVLCLARYIAAAVAEHYSIQLEPEVRLFDRQGQLLEQL